MSLGTRFKSALSAWFGRTIRLTDGEFWHTFYNGDNWAGETVNPETALQVSAFWSCVRLISQTISTLPLVLYERNPDGSRKARADLPLYRVLHDSPNADMTAVQFWEGMVAGLCLSGNSFAPKIISANKVIGLGMPLCSDFMCVERDLNGALRYRYQDPRRGERIYTEDTLFHLRGFGLGGDVGLAPITMARQSLSASRAVDRSAATVFANGMRPSGWLLYKGGTLTPEQREQARKSLIEPMQGPKNTGKVGILEADFDYKQITIPPDDMQMLETRQFNVEDICRWLGVPPILVGHASSGQTMWGSGVEQIMIGWLTLGLRPYLSRIEQSIRRSLMSPAERETLYAEFSVEGLLRADTAARAQFYSTMVQNGLYTRNEVRAKENLPGKEGGDELTIQVNLQALSRILDQPVDATSPAATLSAAAKLFAQLAADADNVLPFKPRKEA